MKNFTKLNRVLVILIAAGCLPATMAVSAQTADYSNYQENGWSAGMNIGKSEASIDSAAIRASLESNGFGVNAIATDASTEGYKIYLGYQFGRYLALEGGFFDLGAFGFQAATEPETQFGGNLKLQGWNLDVVGILPFTDRFSAFGRIGVTQNDTKTRFSSNGLISTARYNQQDNDTQHKFGLGLQYDISAAFTVRLEAERYRVDDLVGNDGDIDLYSLGLVYRFGHNQQRYAATVAPEPASPAAVPAKQPSPVVAAAEVLVLEDVHFNFDTAELNADTKVILRQHVRTLQANPNAKVRIAGYTSASGTAEYNQALSERRAESIKTFLVSEGIAANRFKTIGFGERNPAEREAKPAVLRSDTAKANMRGLFEIIVE
ncbi:OmpA family protein [Arsukibacterium sp.]|uniref:OmpA family protein n=1 Tax=Arsukibacterium sp. TaxID=1977258 RepID=UPI001BD30C76|nr:OmpA family protein [Arsukibacterium sp.]